MNELGKWCIEGRDVFIDRYSVNNGIETMTKEEAEARLNEHTKLLQAVNDKDQELFEEGELVGELREGIHNILQQLQAPRTDTIPLREALDALLTDTQEGG